MKLTVTGRHIDITNSIRDHLDRKLEKTFGSLNDQLDVHIALSVEKHRQFAEVTVKDKGFSVHSEEETKNLYTAIDNALEKVNNQLKKHKERAKDIKIKKSNKTISPLIALFLLLLLLIGTHYSGIYYSGMHPISLY